MMHNLDHDTRMAHMAVDCLSLKLNGCGRYLDRIKEAIDEGVAISPRDAVAVRLANDAATLRGLAASIEQCRAALINNSTLRLQLVAAE
jgi:hypothetical protein